MDGWNCGLIRKDAGVLRLKSIQILKMLLLLIMSMLCGVMMLLLATGQYSVLVYLGYIKDVKLFALNILPVSILILLLYAITGKCWIAYLSGGSILYIISLCNYFKLYFRDDPLMFEDILLAREATAMVETYSLFVDWKIIAAFAVICLGTVLLYLLFKKEKSHWKNRMLVGLVACFIGVGIYPFYINNDIYSNCDNYSQLNRNSATQIYVAHGFLYPFLYSAFQNIETPPEKYSKQQVVDILMDYKESDIPVSKQVNVIAVMREAYVDFSKYNIDGLECDGYDWYHQLQQESYCGELYVNVFGGGTIHTEREFLTGDYKVKNFRGNTNSYVWYFRDQGYITEGCHPYYQWFYNRRNVNPYLGFESYRYYENDFETMTKAYFPEDVYFYSEIYHDYKNKDSDAPYFSFNVNVQSHGPCITTGWFGNWGNKEYLTGSQYSTECKFAMNNYMNVIMDSDKQLESFIGKLEGEKEPIVFVLFSDHLPWMGDGNIYYEEMGIDFSQDSEESNRMQYTTEYLIWANDAAKEKLGNNFAGKGPTISPCYLMNLLFAQCSWEGPAFMQAMSEMMEVMPVVSTNWSFIFDGNYCRGIPEEYTDLYDRFENLQYYWRKEFMY